jgi:3-hydroxybutyryl-CoA dehydratase
MMTFPQQLAEVVRNVDRARVRAYAGASGDHNPLHLDDKFAAHTPFGRTIAHGMLILAFISEMMTLSFGKLWSECGSLRVRFKSPVFVGQTVSSFGNLLRDDSTVGLRQLTYSVGCRNTDGDVVVSGTATLSIHSDGGAE